MKKTHIFLLFIIILTIFCIEITNAQLGTDWTQATANANWTQRLASNTLIYDNKMWIISGADGNGYLNDVWFSSDGIDWTQATANANWSPRYYANSVVFDNKMWIMGGYDGNTFSTDVWYSSDGVDWTQATPYANWHSLLGNGRVGFKLLVYDNKMWIIGGNDGNNILNDVWYSSDGENWTQATANANWSVRFGLDAIVFDNKMWIMDGTNGNDYYNDVWFSSDGENWTQATANANWSQRYFANLIVFDNKMWIMGGFDAYSNIYYNDIWFSSDGIDWTQATANANWSPRYYSNPLIFNNKTWIIGGTYDSSYYNDVWFTQTSCTYILTNNSITNCQIDDTYTLEHISNNEICFPSYNTTENCNYCSANIIANVSACNINGTQNINYIDTNYTNCCLTTGLPSDCIINDPAYYPTNQTCNYYITDFNCRGDPTPVINKKMNIVCELPNEEAYCCVVNIYQGNNLTDLLATNPEYTFKGSSSVFPQDQETRTCFTPNNRLLNAYYTDKEIRPDTAYKVEVKCTSNSTTLLSQYAINPEYHTWDWFTHRVEWFGNNPIQITITTIIIILFILVIAFFIKKAL